MLHMTSTGISESKNKRHFQCAFVTSFLILVFKFFLHTGRARAAYVPVALREISTHDQWPEWLKRHAQHCVVTNIPSVVGHSHL